MLAIIHFIARCTTTNSSPGHPFKENINVISDLFDDYVNSNFLTVNLKDDSEEAKEIKFLKKQIRLFLKRMPNSQDKLLVSIFRNIFDNFDRLGLDDTFKPKIEKRLQGIIDAMMVMTAPLQRTINRIKATSEVTFESKGIVERIKNRLMGETEAKKLRDTILPNIYYLYALSRLTEEENYNTCLEIEHSLIVLDKLVQIMYNWISIAKEGVLNDFQNLKRFDKYICAVVKDESSYLQEFDKKIYSTIHNSMERCKVKQPVPTMNIVQLVYRSLYLLQKNVDTVQEEERLLAKIDSLFLPKSGNKNKEIKPLIKPIENIKKMGEILTKSYDKDMWELLDHYIEPDEVTEMLKGLNIRSNTIEQYKFMINIALYFGLCLLLVNTILLGLNILLGRLK